ncbi:MAG: ABC transporter ATP-binding protein, partial [Erysipelotrichaceae bacterium]|nr:ABC transporter ATP-binding protein [Erysipelotrichaceae bacterium]
MSELVISSLSKIYPDDVIALDNLSLTIPPHSFVVILGPSGCGKTTLLRLICGLDKPTSGDILINNKSVLTKKPHERKIAMVFQEPSLFPMMKVKDNLYYGLAKSQPIEPITDKLHITELLNRYPEECSKGQQQRISIARALLHHPDFYLFDEPLANLDTPLKFELIDVIKRIYQESTASFIYVTHDQTEAQLLATQL